MYDSVYFMIVYDSMIVYSVWYCIVHSVLCMVVLRMVVPCIVYGRVAIVCHYSTVFIVVHCYYV